VCPIWLFVLHFFGFECLKPFSSSVGWNKIWTHDLSIVSLVRYLLNLTFTLDFMIMIVETLTLPDKGLRFLLQNLKYFENCILPLWLLTRISWVFWLQKSFYFSHSWFTTADTASTILHHVDVSDFYIRYLLTQSFKLEFTTLQVVIQGDFLNLSRVKLVKSSEPLKQIGWNFNLWYVRLDTDLYQNFIKICF